MFRNIGPKSSKIDVLIRYLRQIKLRRTIFSSFFVHFEFKTDKKSSPQMTENRGHRFHAIMLSYPHTFVHSYFHTFILPYYYTLILSYPHSLLLSYIHTLILSYPRTLVLSYPLTLLFSRAKPPTSARSARVRPPHASMRSRFRALVISWCRTLML